MLERKMHRSLMGAGESEKGLFDCYGGCERML